MQDVVNCHKGDLLYAVGVVIFLRLLSIKLLPSQTMCRLLRNQRHFGVLNCNFAYFVGMFYCKLWTSIGSVYSLL